VVFVDPSGGYRGIHNSSFLELLARHSGRGTISKPLEIGVAVNKRITKHTLDMLEGAGVSVLPAFSLHGYQLGACATSLGEITAYVAMLGREFSDLFEEIGKHWPGAKI